MIFYIHKILPPLFFLIKMGLIKRQCSGFPISVTEAWRFRCAQGQELRVEALVTVIQQGSLVRSANEYHVLEGEACGHGLSYCENGLLTTISHNSGLNVKVYNIIYFVTYPSFGMCR